MTVFYKFPLKLAEISAKNAKQSYEESKPHSDYASRGVAGYLTQDGQIRRAYDPYDPEYPAGTTPGLCDVFFTLEYYPNDSHGYKYRADNFIPAHEITRNTPLNTPEMIADPVGKLRIAYIRDLKGYEGHDAMIWAFSELEMAAWIDALPDDTNIRRCKVARHMSDPAAIPQFAFVMDGAAGAECHISDTPGALVSGLSKRLPHIDVAGIDPIVALDKIERRLKSCGTHAFVQSYEQTLYSRSSIEQFTIGQLLGYGNEIIRHMVGGEPEIIEQQDETPVYAAKLCLNGKAYVEYSRDKNSLGARVRHRVSCLTGSPCSGVEDIAHYCSERGIDISYASGTGCVAYGYEPVQFAFIEERDHANTVLVAEHLYELLDKIRGYVAERRPGLDCDGWNFGDAARFMEDDPYFQMEIFGLDHDPDEIMELTETTDPDDLGPF